MDKLEFQPTQKTPYVLLDPSGKIRFKGRSIPEDVSLFYEDILDWIIAFASSLGINQIALAGGVSANSGLRKAIVNEAARRDWEVFIPPFQYTTDNAAMIAINGYYRFLKGEFTSEDVAPMAKMYF